MSNRPPGSKGLTAGSSTRCGLFLSLQPAAAVEPVLPVQAIVLEVCHRVTHRQALTMSCQPRQTLMQTLCSRIPPEHQAPRKRVESLPTVSLSSQHVFKPVIPSFSCATTHMSLAALANHFIDWCHPFFGFKWMQRHDRYTSAKVT